MSRKTSNTGTDRTDYIRKHDKIAKSSRSSQASPLLFLKTDGNWQFVANNVSLLLSNHESCPPNIFNARRIVIPLPADMACLSSSLVDVATVPVWLIRDARSIQPKPCSVLRDRCGDRRVVRRTWDPLWAVGSGSDPDMIPEGPAVWERRILVPNGRTV